MGVQNPPHTVVKAIKGTVCFSLFDHNKHISETLNHQLDNQDQQCLNLILQRFDDNRRQTIQRTVEGKISIWLTVIPVAHHISGQLNFGMH